jgi:hypothetical protein
MANNQCTQNKLWDMEILPTEELSRECTIEFSNVLFCFPVFQSEILAVAVDEHFVPGR